MMCSILLLMNALCIENMNIYSSLDRTWNFPWSEHSVGGEKYHESHKHTHTTTDVIYTERTTIRTTQDKKVNKHLVMKINDTNHTQALTHFSLFNCNGWDALILITYIAALMSFSVRLQSSPCAYHYRWEFKAIIITMTKVLTSTLRWVLLMQ